MNLEQATVYLTELAEGWECGAKLEDAIVAAYQPELDAFTASKLGDGQAHDVRLLRAVLDARGNRDRFRKDADAVRTLLSALTPSSEEPSSVSERSDEQTPPGMSTSINQPEGEES